MAASPSRQVIKNKICLGLAVRVIRGGHRLDTRSVDPGSSVWHLGKAYKQLPSAIDQIFAGCRVCAELDRKS